MSRKRSAPAAEQTIGDVISDALVAKGYTVRGLARELAGPSADHKEVERRRRAIYRALDDSIPDEEMAAKLSRALGVPAEKLTRPAAQRVGRGRIQRLEHRLAELEARADQGESERRDLVQLVAELTDRVEHLEARVSTAQGTG